LANQDSSDPLAIQIGSLIHQLRNVFSAVRGFATVIAQELRPDDPARDDVDQILKAIDHGVEVTVQLAAIRSPGPGGGGAAKPQPPRTATILVVEDDDLVRSMTVRLLRRSGYQTLDAATAEDAEACARAHAAGIDLLLADVGLPRSGGPELATRMCEQLPSLKVLYMSGLGLEAILEQGVPIGAALLEKPFAPITLLARVDGLLAPGDS
jgi:CheY-like chemotaxis protein